MPQGFSCEFCEISKNTFFLQNTSSDCFWNIEMKGAVALNDENVWAIPYLFWKQSFPQSTFSGPNGLFSLPVWWSLRIYRSYLQSFDWKLHMYSSELLRLEGLLSIIVHTIPMKCRMVFKIIFHFIIIVQILKSNTLEIAVFAHG